MGQFSVKISPKTGSLLNGNQHIAKEQAQYKKSQDAEYTAWWKKQIAEQQAVEKAAAEDAKRQKREALVAERARVKEIAAAQKNAAQQERARQRELASAQKQRDRAMRDFGRSVQNVGRTTVQNMRNTVTVVRNVGSAVATTGRAFVKLGTDAVKVAQRIGQAMQRTGREVAKVAQEAQRATSSFAKWGAAGSLAAGGGAAAFIQQASSAAHDFVQEQERVSNVLGLTISDFSAFSAYASQASMGVDEVRQTMLRFANVTGEAAEGGTRFSEIFESLGVATRDAKGNLLPITSVLDQFARATSKLSGGERSRILTQVFGDNRSVKIGRLLSKIANDDLPTMQREIEEMRKKGPILTERDLKISQDYDLATNELRQSFMGLRVAIFSAFGPSLTAWVRVATQVMVKHRSTVVNFLIAGYNRFVTLLRDALNVFFGIDKGFAIQHKWMLTIRERFKELVTQIRAALPNAIAMAQAAMEEMRVRLQAMVGEIREYAENMVGRIEEMAARIQQVVSDIRASFSDFRRGLGAAEFSEVETAMYNIGAAVTMTYNAVKGFTVELYRMIALGQDAANGFEWMNEVRDWTIHLVESAKVAIGWFKDLILVINDVLSVFGVDITQLAIFIGLVKFTGIFGPLVAAMNLTIATARVLWATLAGGAAAGVAGAAAGAGATGMAAGAAAGAAGAAATRVGGLVGAFQTATRAAGFFVTRVLGPAGLIAAAAPIFLSMMENLGRAVGDWLFDTKQALAQVKTDMERTFDMTGGAKPGSLTPAEYAEVLRMGSGAARFAREARIEAERAARAQSYVTAPGGITYGRSTGGSMKVTPRGAAAYPGAYGGGMAPPPEKVATYILKMNGRTVELQGSPSELDAILSSGLFERG